MVVLVKIKNSSNCITQETNVYKCSALCQCSYLVPVMLTAPPLCLSQISGCKAKPYKPPGRAHYLLLYQHETKKNMYWTYIVNSNMLHLMEGNGMKWNKSSNIHFPTDKKKVLFFIFLFFHLLVTSFSVNTDSEGAGPSCTPACICSSCWCVKICLCLQYDSEVTSHLMVQLVACSTTNQSLICFKKKNVLLLHVHVQW